MSNLCNNSIIRFDNILIIRTNIIKHSYKFLYLIYSKKMSSRKIICYILKKFKPINIFASYLLFSAFTLVFIQYLLFCGSCFVNINILLTNIIDTCILILQQIHILKYNVKYSNKNKHPHLLLALLLQDSKHH